METLNSQINTALKNKNFIQNNAKQYRILNKDGLIYSQFLGWVEINNKVYGHIFTEQELSVVLPILKDHGYKDIHTELDKTGTLFVAAANSPFGNPSKMVHLLIFTGLFFFILFLMIKFNLFELFSSYISNNP